MRFWKNNRVDYRPVRRIVRSHIWYRTCVPELRVLANGTMIVVQLIDYRWPRIICRLQLSPPITQWSIFMVSTGLFQAFRWAENGASGEQRENNKRAGIEKESNMSIAQWRPYFHCQPIRPTQLIDQQLIMYFFFILRLLNNILWEPEAVDRWRAHAMKVQPRMFFA